MCLSMDYSFLLHRSRPRGFSFVQYLNIAMKVTDITSITVNPQQHFLCYEHEYWIIGTKIGF